MRVIFNRFPEPSDQVIQNLTIGDFPLGPAFEPWQDLGVAWHGENVLQGEWVTSRMPGFAVPRALVGWNPYFAKPESIGPMATSNGRVGMVPIGPAKPASPLIDPAIQWLYSQVPQDSNGELYGLEVMLPSPSAPAFDRVLSSDNTLAAPTPLIANPRREVKDSGLLKVITSTTLPDNFGRVIQLLYPPQQSYQVFLLTGTTVDETSVPVPDCRVIAYQSGWRYVEAGPKIIAETVSDGVGNFTMLLRNIDYQLVAYKEGAPDLGGLTRQDVTPIVATIIYMRDPTVPAGAGAGGTFPAEDDVEFGVVYGPTDNLTGTVTLPLENDVRDGVNYGADGIEFNGDLVLPAEADVLTGVGFGADGTEFTGSASGGGATTAYTPRRSR